jgi:hypothetical protein
LILICVIRVDLLIDSADEFLGEVLIAGAALEAMLKPQETAGQPNFTEIDLACSTVPAYANMKKYVGGKLKIGTYEEKLFKVMVVEADKLAQPEGGDVGCQPEARVYWKDQLIGRTTQKLTSTNPLWLNQSVSLDWSAGVITEAIPKVRGGDEDAGSISMASVSGSAVVSAVHDLKGNQSIMPKTGRRQSLTSCPPEMFNFLTMLADQVLWYEVVVCCMQVART